MLRNFIFTFISWYLTDALTVHYTDWIDLLNIEPVVVIWGPTSENSWQTGRILQYYKCFRDEHLIFFPATFTPYQKCYKKWRTSGICWKINAPRKTFKHSRPFNFTLQIAWSKGNKTMSLQSCFCWKVGLTVVVLVPSNVNTLKYIWYSHKSIGQV